MRRLQPSSISRNDMDFRQKLWHISWSMVLLIALIASVGFLNLYSAANGHFDPWASRQMVRFGGGLVVMIVVALIDIRFWLRYAYVLYIVGAVLLLIVDIYGFIGMGAQRWLDLGFFQLQPSEIMKIALVLVLARYFHGATTEEIGKPLFLIPPLLLVLIPVALVLKQPDLGTAMMLIMASGAMFFLAGVRIWKFLVVIAGCVGAVPVGWQFLRDYQKNRILTFLNPENDPLGAGYHITQSKIALGSGGLFGRGFLQGTQSHLNFLPEKQTDFIFTMLAEEWGMIGGLALIMLYMLLIFYGYMIAFRSRSHFGRLVALGITTTFFIYVFINIAMVMGLIPVVGVPLPLISYGGTAMLTLLFGFGLIMSVHVHKDVYIGPRGAYDL